MLATPFSNGPPPSPRGGPTKRLRMILSPGSQRRATRSRTRLRSLQLGWVWLLTDGAPVAYSCSATKVRVMNRRLSATPSALLTTMNFLSIIRGRFRGSGRRLGGTSLSVFEYAPRNSPSAVCADAWK